MEELYDKRFCDLDDYAIPVIYLNEPNKRVKRIMSFHPKHNQHTLKNQGIDKPKEWLYNVDRDIIETDRTGFRGYDRIYSKYLNKYRDEPINLLEIGTEWGYGLLGWSRLFPKANVYGMEKHGEDYHLEYDRIKNLFPEESKRITFDYSYDSRDLGNWKKLYGDQKFDVIIDDGSHVSSTQLETLKIASDFIKKGGKYFIEDIKLEYVNLRVANEFLNSLLTLKETSNFKEIEFYKHVNHERLKYLKLSRSEKEYSIYEKFMKENYHIEEERRRLMAAEQSKIKMEKDSGNYFNYSVVLIK